MCMYIRIIYLRIIGGLREFQHCFFYLAATTFITALSTKL